MSPVSEWSYFFSTVLSLIFVICIIGNILILIVVYRNDVFGNSCQAKLLITNTAIVDLVCSLDSLVTAIGYIDIEWIAAQGIFCRLSGALTWMMKIISHFSHFSLAISRYYAIAEPLAANSIFTRRVALSLVICSWGGVILIGSAVELLSSNTNEIAPDQSRCMGRVFGGKLKIAVPVISMCLFTATLITNIKTWRANRRRLGRVRANGNAPHPNDVRSRVDVTKSILLITVYYIFCFLPLFVLVFVQKLSNNGIPIVLLRLAKLLFDSNHASNAIVFSFAQRRFRDSILRLFRRRPRPRRGNEVFTL